MGIREYERKLSECIRRSEKTPVISGPGILCGRKRIRRRWTGLISARQHLGTLTSQLQYNDEGGVVSSNELIRARILHQWTRYAKHVFKYNSYKPLMCRDVIDPNGEYMTGSFRNTYCAAWLDCRTQKPAKFQLGKKVAKKLHYRRSEERDHHQKTAAVFSLFWNLCCKKPPKAISKVYGRT